MRNIAMHKTAGMTLMACALGLALAAPVYAESNEDKGETIELEGLDLAQKGDFAGAIAKYQEAMKYIPNDKGLKENYAETLNAAGVQAYGNGDYATAEKDFTEALNLVPNFKHAKDNLAMTKGGELNAQGADLYKQGNILGAIDKFQQAIAAEPNFKQAQANLATALADQAHNNGDLVTEVAKRKEAVGFAPDNKVLQDKLAQAQAALDAQNAAAKPPPAPAPASGGTTPSN